MQLADRPSQGVQKRLLSLRAAAQWLGIDRGRLGRYVAAGIVRSVFLGRSPRVPVSELERIEREGLPDLSTTKRAPRRRRASSSSAMSEAEVRARLAEF